MSAVCSSDLHPRRHPEVAWPGRGRARGVYPTLRRLHHHARQDPLDGRSQGPDEIPREQAQGAPGRHAHRPALMAGLDTNILVRWLVDDDAAQSRRIAERLRLAARREETLFVPMMIGRASCRERVWQYV